jgi:hypothetical protein
MHDSADEIQSHMAPVPKIFSFRSTDRGLRLNVDDLLDFKPTYVVLIIKIPGNPRGRVGYEV